MAKMKQFRSADLSRWQSAVDQVVAKDSAGAQALDVNSPVAVTRPNQADPMVAAMNAIAQGVDETGAEPDRPDAQAAAALGVGDVAKFCSATAFKLAKAKLLRKTQDAAKFEQELDPQFGLCDARWATVVAVYLESAATLGPIPYRKYDEIGDFVINTGLPAKAKLAVVGDWGTGDDAARFVLKQIKVKDPDVVIHLGDVYYSGTEHEFQNYFYKIWQATLGIPKVNWGDELQDVGRPATYSLAGNHDMYAGGGPYYTAIDMLRQPASYFCLRNDAWQFIALDTGLHDSNPVAGSLTHLEPSEVDWLKDKIQNAGGRKTVLLSHHQLFSAYEHLPSNSVNRVNNDLLQQVQGTLPNVTVWLWGHEHNLVIYKKFQNVLARCVGHGAFPVGVDEIKVPDPNVPIEAAKLGTFGAGGLFQHGYAFLELDGAAAKITYYECDPTQQTETVLFAETL